MLTKNFWGPLLEKSQSIFANKKVLIGLWICLALITTAKQISTNSYNNYLIFKYSYWHAVDHLNLYLEYPSQYNDSNHYGPFFSLFFTPFAVLPNILGMLLWQLGNTLLFFWSLNKLPLSENQKLIMMWICSHELLTSLFSFQINPGIAAIIILSFVLIENKKDFWAAFFIVLGTFIKLYGIVGLAFFFFSKQKLKLTLSLAFWVLAFSILPMIFFGYHYILQSYSEWYQSLAHKNIQNGSLDSYQDISVMGMTRRIFQDSSIPNLPFLVGGLILYGLPYFRLKQYKNLGFRLMILVSTLLFTVLFSSGSESPTYIIAFAGVAIWFIIQDRPLNKWHIFLLIFALVLTSFSPSDLFPKYIRDHYVKHYALKALPCLLIWMVTIYQMIRTDFSIKNIKYE
ncbi:MAG: rane protein [Sphingobacteriales bacterium]|nr:rane protein [Sphingobacteriales bacterium]